MNLKRKENLSGVIAIATLLIFLFTGVVDIFGSRSGVQCLLTFGFFWSGFFALLTILSLLIPIVGMNISVMQQVIKKIPMFADIRRFKLIRLGATIISSFFYLFIIILALDAKNSELPLTAMGGLDFVLILVNITIAFRINNMKTPPKAI